MIRRSLDQYIETSADIAGGEPRIAGRRITVQDVAIWHDRMGRSVDEIAAEHDLSLAEVHAALAYYFDHRAAIDASLEQREAFIAGMRASLPSKLRQRLSGANGAGGAS